MKNKRKRPLFNATPNEELAFKKFIFFYHNGYNVEDAMSLTRGYGANSERKRIRELVRRNQNEELERVV